MITAGQYDPILTPALAAEEAAAWRSHCPECDVSKFVLPNTGHLFMAHKSMPVWTQKVVGWLRSRGIVQPPR